MANTSTRKYFFTALYLTLNLAMQLFVQLFLVHNLENKKLFLFISIGIWIASIVLIASIRFLREKGTVIPVLLNGLASSFAIHAYMLHIDRELTASLIGLVLIGSLVILALLFFLTNLEFIQKHEIVLLIPILALIISAILLWIFADKAIFSQIFFALIMTIAFYIGAEEPGKPGSTLGKRLAFSSFGSIFIILIVAIIIFSTGEFLEGLLPDGEIRRSHKKPKK